MSSRLIVSGQLTGAVVRRKRKVEGALFAMAWIADRDRIEERVWKVFINDPELIEHVEAIPIGAPIAVSGHFAFSASGAGPTPKLSIA